MSVGRLSERWARSTARLGRGVGACTRANGRRIPEVIASLSSLTMGKDCTRGDTGNEARTEERERFSPACGAICIQRPRCRERGEVAINNATHHQYLAGITTRTPTDSLTKRRERNEERERERERERGREER